MSTTTADLRVPLQTPLQDERGNLTRPWILFLQGLIPSNVNTTTKGGGWARINFLDYIPQRLHASIAAGTCEESLQGYMQTALDALLDLGGGIIDLPGGTYPLGDGDGLTMVQNQTIVGDGSSRSTITYAGDGAAIQIGDNTQLRARMGLRDMKVMLTGAGNTARGVAVYSSLIVHMRDVEIETDQAFVALDDDAFHSSFDQVGLLMHGGTWGSLRGLLSVSGTSVTWKNGDKFGPWCSPGRILYFGGAAHTIADYIDPEHLTVTAAPGDTAEAEYTATLHGFNAFFNWKDCFIRGLFKTGLRGTGRAGWGTGSSHIEGGGIIWTWHVSPPADYGYIGFHAESFTALVAMLNVENYDVCMKLEDPSELVVPRFEGYRSKALWLCEAGPPNCTIDGNADYAVYATGTFVQVHNAGAVAPFDESYIGKSITIEKAGPNYAPLTTTITAVNPNGIECTIADPCTYYALHERYGGQWTRIFSGGAYSAQGGSTFTDETKGRYSSIGTGLDQVQFVQNNLQGQTRLHGHTNMVGNYSLTWTETGGSSAVQWTESDAITAKMGVFGDKRLNLYAGVVRCQECGATVVAGSNEIALTVYPGQIAAVEPGASVLGQRISVERALDGRKALITTVTGMTTIGATHTQGKINITTTVVYDGNGDPINSTLLEGLDTRWTVALDGKNITIDGNAYRFVYSTPDRAFIDLTTPYLGADQIAASYSIAYNTYTLTLADAAGASVTDAAVRFGDEEDDWQQERTKDIALKAQGRIRFQMGNIEKMAVDGSGVALYDTMRVYGNKAVSWNTLGGSAGLNWNKPDPDGGLPLNYGAVVNNTSYLGIRAGEARVDHDLILEVLHEDSDIVFKVDGETKLAINASGVQGLVSLAVTGNNSFTNLTASQWVKIENNAAPLLILRQTHATTRTMGIDIGWGGFRQWIIGTGLPAGSYEGIAFTEYDDDVFDAVRMMLFKGGNVAIGSTSDDGANKLQVTGNVKITGNCQITGTLPSLFIEGATPFLQTRNSSSSKVGGLDLGWGGHRQWLFSAGVPSSGSTAFALTEYTDGVYDGVRWMLFKGGNMVVGATTDDGANKLQVTGNAKVTGALDITGALTAGSFTLSSALPVASGGTGATDAAGARLNLGVDAAPSVFAGALTIPKLTSGGLTGYIAISATGRITAWSNPT